MTELFEPLTINGMRLRNRMVRSATWEGMCDPDGRPTPKLVDYNAALAQGGIGLIVSGYTYVSPEGKQLPGKMGIYSDDFADDFAQLTAGIHAAGGVVAIQLVHAGGQADPNASGCEPVAPSAVQVDQFPKIPARLSREKIATIIDNFGAAARRAKQWGFDGVQLHGAHGYLINQFLSPLTNQRSDDYGGGIENRSRFLMQVYDAVRRRVGDDYPLMIKLNAADNLEGGLELHDALYAARMLDERGIDAIEVSSGTRVSGELGPVRGKINAPAKEAYNLEVAQQIKAAVNCPVMVVGGFRSYDVAASAIGEQGMDLIAFSRPLIRQPDLPARWQSGNRETAACISCSKCFLPGMQEGGIYCVVEKKLRQKAEKKQS